MGERIMYDYYDSIHLVHGRRLPRKFGKVYQQCYALQKELLPEKYKNIFIPPDGLRNVLIRDVSFEYFPDMHISVRLEPSILFNKKIGIFMCIQQQ